MNLEQIDTSTTAGKGLIDAARAALPFIAYAFDQGIDGAEEAGRAIEEALRDDQLQGYVLVPVVLPDPMLDVLYRAEGDMSDADMQSLWADILAARPEVP
ncbi:TPA: hypothetical protein ACOFBV_000841 [Stenotrophomonas maltophilia]